MTRGPFGLGCIRLVGRGERFFILNLDLQEARNGQGDAETDLGFVAQASQDRADFLHQFCHSDLLLVTVNDAAQATYKGAGLHPEGRNAVEKGAALAGPGRYVMVRAKDWPISRRRYVSAKAAANVRLRSATDRSDLRLNYRAEDRLLD